MTARMHVIWYCSLSATIWLAGHDATRFIWAGCYLLAAVLALFIIPVDEE